MKYKNIDHFLAHAYADEEHVIVSNGSLYREDRSQKTGLTPQEKAQYYATVRHIIDDALKHDEDRLNCIKAKYGVGLTFSQAVAFLANQIMEAQQTDTSGCCLFELVKYTYDRKKNLRQLCSEFDVSMNALLKDKKFIDGYIAAIEYRALQEVELALQHYICEAVQGTQKEWAL